MFLLEHFYAYSGVFKQIFFSVDKMAGVDDKRILIYIKMYIQILNALPVILNNLYKKCVSIENNCVMAWKH